MRLLLALLLSSTAASAAAADCQKVTEVCVDGPATKQISGYSVYRDCWRYQSSFSCISQNTVDDCQPLRDRGCSQTGSACIDTGSSGLCQLYEQTYQCKAAGGTTSTVANCGSQQFCMEGNCFSTGYQADSDFAKSVAMLEAQREAGKYLDPDSLHVFNGYDNRCRKKLFGLVNCCSGGGTSTSQFTNLNLILAAGGQVFGAAGSSYTYDALFAADAPQAVMAGFDALFGVGGGTSALAGLMAGDVSVASFVGSLAPGPWTVAILAIQLSGLLSCEEAEKVLAMKRDARLCHGVGSFCSKRIGLIKVCVEKTETYCCFNSRLARILNEQGRAQIGRGWGSAQSPDCGGFSLAQLQSLDFSRMDLAEFYAEIAPTLPDAGATRARVQQKVDSYYKQ